MNSPIHQTHSVIAMAKSSQLLSVSLCLFVLFRGCLARQQWQQQQNQCQLDRLEALEPDNRVEYEGGQVETWNPNHEQFQCAGVAIVRKKVQPNGLVLPHFSNAPQLIYIVRGKGIQGTVLPGCAETYQESQGTQQFRGGEGGQRSQDEHQKIRHFRQGDILVVPAGAAHWAYNTGNEELVCISLLDTSNNANQLDLFPREFYLAGNGKEEFRQQQEQGRRSRRGEESRHGQGERSCNNVFCGFDSRILAEAFNVDQRLVERLQGENDNRGHIVMVQGGELEVVRPPTMEDEREREGRRYGHDNGLEETICSMRLRENIGDPSRADIFTPEAGRISTLNSHNLPVLRSLQLSAEFGVLYNNALMVPHWNLNAHSIIYITKGQGRIQVVDNYGQRVFDNEVREGQVITVPQNFAIVKRAEGERLEWVAFKTNDNAMVNTLSGKTSAIRAIPADVLATAFQISAEEARRLKFNTRETSLTRGQGSSRRRVVAEA